MITNDIDINIVKQVVKNYLQADVEIERMKSGSSTYVYCVKFGTQTYYLRVLPEDISFAAEAKAHKIMLEHGINVPSPIYFEHKNSLLNKSIMLTSEIPGCPLDKGSKNKADILIHAGKQLALINSIGVDGFSWVDRSNFIKLTGEKRTFNDYYYDTLYSDIAFLQKYGFDIDKIKLIMDKAYPILETTDAFLVHGDFDISHIYCTECMDEQRHTWMEFAPRATSPAGYYSGIIDFGEIRGSHYLYDLGHFKLHEDFDSFQHLAKGYNNVKNLTADDYIKIDYLALFVGLGRGKYESYRGRIKKQLEILTYIS